MTNKAYREYCAQHRDAIPVFHQDWWLDAVVGPMGWRGLVSKAAVSNQRAILPVVTRQRWGITIIRNPPLTPYQGPWWAGYEQVDAATRHRVSQQLWPDLLGQLPRHVSFRQRFHPQLREALPWHEWGYTLETRYTFTLNLAQQPTQLHQQFRRDVRQRLRQASPASFRTVIDSTLFFPLLKAVYARQQQAVPYTAELLERLVRTGKEQEALSLYLCEQAGAITGGLLLAKDASGLYVLASGLTAQGRKTGAYPALIWHIIRSWQGKAQQLDFCGSMLPSVADRNAAYGATGQLVLAAKRQAWWLNLIEMGL